MEILYIITSMHYTSGFIIEIGVVTSYSTHHIISIIKLCLLSL